jgi:hypothetical protein
MDKSKKKVSSWIIVLLSFVCLAPILGGIVGLILVVFSLVAFKNRWLLIVGAMGVLVTIVSMVTLQYFGTHRGPFDASRIVVAKSNMGTIIRELEYYEKNYGHYPDSLIFLKASNPRIMLYDPIQEVNPKISDHKFYYKLINHKYYLFSKGFDGIPFTKDDIFPDVDINSNSIGLIIPFQDSIYER